MSGLTGWETMQGEAGEIYQAGIPSCPIDEHDDGMQAFGWITRALVLAVYFTDEDVRRDWTNAQQRAVLCDVRTIGRYSRNLFKVPVLQRTHGLWDEDLYIPRPARVNIGGGTFSSGSAGVDGAENAPTPAEQTDGDHVLVGFLDNDPRLPVILPFTLGHPAANARPAKAAGRVRRIRHNGVLLEWDAEGNLTLDASSAAKPDYTGAGAEQSNSGTGGKITIKTKDGVGAESTLYLDERGGVKVTDGAGDFLELTKAGKQIEVNAGTLVKLVGGAQLQVQAPAVQVAASASFQVTSAAIMLGSAVAAMPLMLAPPPVVSAWGVLDGILQPLAQAWKQSPVNATPATHGELATVLEALEKVCALVVPGAGVSIITKAS